MKNIIINTVFVLMSLFSVSTVLAQNPHINKQDKQFVLLTVTSLPSTTFSVCIFSCRISGLGNASSVSAQLVAEGTITASCFNGGNDPGPIPGQSFSAKSAKVTFIPDANGNITINGLCTEPIGGCKTKGGKDWTSNVTEATVTNLFLIINNKQVSLNDFLSQINPVN